MTRFTMIAALAAVTLCAACGRPSAPATAAAPTIAADPSSVLNGPLRDGVRLLIANAHARATPTAGGNAAGFLRITNTGNADDRLLGGDAEGVGKLEIHQTTSAGGVMQMRELKDGLPIPAGQTVELAPGGTHLMLIGVQRALVAGESLVVTLRFEKMGAMPITLHVDALN